MKARTPDLILGLAALFLSIGYLLTASQIPESLLSDSVGASGVPKMVGWMLGALGLVLCGRSLKFGAHAESKTEVAPETEEAAATGMRPHLLALGLLAILSVYVFVLPYLGYPLSISLLLAVVARYCGTPFNRNLILISIAGAATLWLMFHYLLGIPMPVGSLLEGL